MCSPYGGMFLAEKQDNRIGEKADITVSDVINQVVSFSKLAAI